MKYIIAFLICLFSVNAFAMVMVTNDDDRNYIFIIDCDGYQETMALSERSSMSFEMPSSDCKVIVRGSGSSIQIENNTTYLIDDGQITEE